MARTQTTIARDTSSKDKRNKAVSAASKVVRNMLNPASQVANLLDGIGAIFPPCKVASNILAVSTTWGYFTEDLGVF